MNARLSVPILALAAACARDPLQGPCPNAAVGALAVSEIRGRQSSTSDTLGQWIEIYNTSAAPISLTGLIVEMTSLTGTTTEHIEIRSTTAQVASHAYFVLGQFPDASRPSYVDYGYGDDFTGDLLAGAGMDLVACGTVIDHIVYRSLPTQGTWSYDGARIPDATANDDETAWCQDKSGTGFPGTPKQGNNRCTQ